MRKEWPLLLLIVVYLIVGGLYATHTPAWQAPDEPAHYNYIRQLAAGGLPVIEPGDYDQAYQGEVISSRFDPEYSILPFSYEDWQPPLYYLLQTPIFLLSEGALLPLRLLSVLFGAGVVALAYAIGRVYWTGSLVPGRALALSAAAFVAFLPQHVAILASVNNDSLAELLIASILLLLLLEVRQRTRERAAGGAGASRRWLAVGVLIGLGFLTKATVYIMVPVVGVALLGLYWRRWSAAFRAALWVGVPALLLGLLLWVRNTVVYAGLDPLANAAHDAVVIGQPRTEEWIAQYGAAEVGLRFVQTTFQSFWGQFGWMAVPMPGWVYLPLLLFSLLAIVGLLGLAVAGDRPVPDGHVTRSKPVRRDSMGSTLQLGPFRLATWLLLTTFGLSLLVYVGYNVNFVQHQGRYLFPALIPIAMGVAAGLDFVFRPLYRRLPLEGYIMPLALGVGFVALDLVALYRFVIPSLAF